MIGTSRLSGPSNVNGIDWAAAANSINGTAVTTPVPSTRIHSAVSADRATLSARNENAMTATTAGTNSTNVSPARLSTAPSGTRRLASP